MRAPAHPEDWVISLPEAEVFKQVNTLQAAVSDGIPQRAS